MVGYHVDKKTFSLFPWVIIKLIKNPDKLNEGIQPCSIHLMLPENDFFSLHWFYTLKETCWITDIQLVSPEKNEGHFLEETSIKWKQPPTSHLYSTHGLPIVRK